MYYELYIDVLFLTNFMMDSLILLAVRTVLKYPVSRGWIFCGGAVGSGLTCLVMAVPAPAWVKCILFHTTVNTAMIKIGLHVKTAKDFFRAFALLYITAFLLGGILQAMRPYVRTGSLFFAAAVAAFYILSISFRLIVRVRNIQKKICEVTLCTDKGEYHVRALVDTGNTLTDPISGEAVCVIDQAFARRMFPGTESIKGIRYIPYRSVGGESILPVLRIEKMGIRRKEMQWISRPVIGICEEKISEHEDYQMILNPDILEE